jgi:hypothetical protein
MKELRSSCRPLRSTAHRRGAKSAARWSAGAGITRGRELAGGLGDPLNVYPRPVLARQYIRRRGSRRQWSVEPGPNLALLQPPDIDGTVTPAHNLRARDLSADTWDTTEPALYTAEKYDKPGPASIMRALLRTPAFSDEPLWLHGPGTPWLRVGRTRSLKDDPNTALRFCARKASRLALFELHHDDVLDSLPNTVDSPLYMTPPELTVLITLLVYDSLDNVWRSLSLLSSNATDPCLLYIKLAPY